MAFGTLIIKEMNQLSDEEFLEQLKENPYPDFYIGLEAFQHSAQFDSSMIVYFGKRLSRLVVNDCNERSVRHGLEVIQQQQDDDETSAAYLAGTTLRRYIQSGLREARSWSLSGAGRCPFFAAAFDSS
jgi:hypothetical protein